MEPLASAGTDMDQTSPQTEAALSAPEHAEPTPGPVQTDGPSTETSSSDGSARPKRNDRIHRAFKPLILTLIAIIALLAVYQAGVFVGYRKAMYSFRWSQNYHQIFAGPPQGFIGTVQGKAFMDAHGLFGQVLRVDPNDLIIQDKDDQEKAVHILPDTSILLQRNLVPVTNITTSDRVVIIGQPDEHGEIDAKLIRIFPNN